MGHAGDTARGADGNAFVSRGCAGGSPVCPQPPPRVEMAARALIRGCCGGAAADNALEFEEPTCLLCLGLVRLPRGSWPPADASEY